MEDDRDIRAEFGRRLYELRKRADISQERLANLSGLDRTYVGRAESGCHNPTLVTINRLAKGLDVEPSELLKRPQDHSTAEASLESQPDNHLI
jgi:transcriptional regulator with XRE-family HTH domain